MMLGRRQTFDFRLRQAIHAVLTHLRLARSAADSLFLDLGFESLCGVDTDPDWGVPVSSLRRGLECSDLT